MRKKYSDPLMFPAVLMSGIDIPPSGGEGGQGPETPWGGKSSRTTVNSMGETEPTESITISPTPEESGIADSVAPVENAGTAESEIIPEVAPVIDTLVEEESAAGETIVPAEGE